MKLLTFILLAIAMAGVGCAKSPSRTVTGGTAASLNESAQTAVPPSYPPAYPKRLLALRAPDAHPAPTTQPSGRSEGLSDPVGNPIQAITGGISLPPGWTFVGLEFFEPIAVSEPTILNRTTKTTSTTQPSTSVDIIAPENVGKAWIGICLLAAFVCAVIATVTPLRRFYLVAGVAVGLAMIGLVPPVYFGIVFVGVSVVLLVVAGVYMYRTGMWQTTAKQISAGAERVKKAVNGGEEFNTIMEAAQTVPKAYIRKARGK